jgi:hypothetical protein
LKNNKQKYPIRAQLLEKLRKKSSEGHNSLHLLQSLSNPKKGMTSKNKFFDKSSVQSRVSQYKNSKGPTGEVIGICYRRKTHKEPKRLYTQEDLKTMVYIDEHNQMRNVKVGTSYNNIQADLS